MQTAPSLSELSSTEFAELVALERLIRGTIHALNNAFTAILGEACLVESKTKGDPEREEACQVIRAEIDRCGRLTRALHTRRSAPVAESAEAPDLARIVRDLSGLLAATLSSRLALRVETPEEFLLVRGRAASIELSVILMVQQAAAFAPSSSAELRLRAIDDRGRGRHGVIVELRSPDLGIESAAGRDERAASLPALALHHLAREQGAESEAERSAHALTLRLFLPAFQGEASGAD